MGGRPASTEASGERLYRKMKCTQGGVMLLVRLHADLSGQPIEFVRMMRTIDAYPDPGALFEAGSRLSSTYQWLEGKFGRAAAVRAVIEVSGDILRMVPIN